MQLLKSYLSRYLHEVGGFLVAFAVAGFGIFPMLAITYQIYLLFIYVLVALIGVPLILVTAAVSSISENYRYKFSVLVLAAFLLPYGSRDQVTIYTSAVNWDRIIFAQLLFFTPIIYGFRERHRMMAHWKMRGSWE